MRIRVFYDGQEFVSPNTDEEKAEVFTQRFFEQINEMDKLHMEIERGGKGKAFIVFGKQVLQRCILMFDED